MQQAQNPLMAAAQGTDLMASIEGDPGYQFRKQQGEQAINRSASAAGGRFSGRTLEALQGFNSGLASQEAQAVFDRRATQRGQDIGVGQSLAGLLAQQGQMAQRGGQDISQLQYNLGQGLAGMSVQRGMEQANMARGISQDQAQNMQQAGLFQAGLSTDQAQQLANLQTQQGTATADLYGQNATQLANLYASQGTQLANLQMQIGSGKANALSGLANQYSNIAGMQLPVYEGLYAGAGMGPQAFKGIGGNPSEALNLAASIYGGKLGG
jgi:hypothetical protein